MRECARWGRCCPMGGRGAENARRRESWMAFLPEGGVGVLLGQCYRFGNHYISAISFELSSHPLLYIPEPYLSCRSTFIYLPTPEPSRSPRHIQFIHSSILPPPLSQRASPLFIPRSFSHHRSPNALQNILQCVRSPTLQRFTLFIASTASLVPRRHAI